MPDETGSHIPVLRTRLPGEIWGIATYFNSSRSHVLRENLAKFSASIRSQGLKLLVVELAFDEVPFEVSLDICDLLIHRRSNVVLWQKERLLNIGIEYLPPDCDKVVWLDADIIFENQNWVQDTSRLLESYAVVQPFEHAYWLPQGSCDMQGDPSYGLGEGNAMPGMAAVMSRRTDWRRALANYFEHGHSGFAWAVRRDILDRHRLYDLHVLGGGDITLAHAFYGDEDFWRGRNYWCRNMTKAELAAIAEWSRSIHADIQGSIAATPGWVLHLWHGGIASRNYQDRALILKESDFDPVTDVASDIQGCLRWNSNKPQLHSRVREYFALRSCDSGK